MYLTTSLKAWLTSQFAGFSHVFLLLFTMPKSCCVPGCTVTKRTRPDLKFYIIPVEVNRRKTWLQAIRRARVDSNGGVKLGQVWSPKSNHTYVCSQHFISGEKSSAPNHPDYVPSIFPYNTSSAADIVPLTASLENFNNRRKRAEDRTSQARKRLKLDQRDREPGIEHDDADGESVGHMERDAETVLARVDSVLAELASPLPTDLEPQPPPKPSSEPTEMERLHAEIGNLRKERDEALQEVERLKKELEMCGMYSSSVEDDDDKTEMMTGLSWPVFMQLFIYLSSCLGENPVRKHQPSVPLRDQLFRTLVKLRQGVSFDFLAHISGSNRSTTIDHFWKWIYLMNAKIGFMVKWPERENVHNIIPPVFKEKFPRLTSIIDCFEIFIDAPKNLLARAQSYSQYKKHTTVKVFISCNPYGQINYLSSAWGGRVSDVHLVRDSGFIDSTYHLPGDQILADRGFTLQDDFASACSAELIMPAFTKGKDQLPAREVEVSREVSHVRIHIERVIGHMKNRYTILQGPLPIRCIQRLKDEALGAELSNIDKLLRVCAALTNMGESIVYTEEELN